MIDFSKEIAATIKETASRLQDSSITTVEDMIRPMDVSKYPNHILDIPYGTRTDAEKLDIFYPEGFSRESGGKLPAFLEVHGSAWYFGQKRSVEFEPFLYGRKRGYAVISIGYSLCPTVHYPMPAQEIKGATRFLRSKADEFGIDPDRIVLWGGSAGAHLAALAAASCDTGFLDKDIFGRDEYSAKPNALGLWYGCYDYYENGKYLADWIYQNLFGAEDLSRLENIVKLSSPLTHLTGMACPTYLEAGRNDSVVPYTQSVGYYDRLVRYVGEENCSLTIVEECDHADPKLFAEDNVARMFDFFDRYVK